MDITGFDGQMNGWFDRINPFNSLAKARERSKKAIAEYERKKKNQKQNKKVLTSDQKKKIINKLVNSLSGVDEITGFEDQVGGFASMIKRYKKSIQPGSQIRFVKRTTPNRIKAIELAKRKINSQKIADRKVAEVIQARANQLISKKKPTVKDIFTAKPTPKLVNSLNAVQRSFLRTDLPYQNPSYQFAIEPAVDRGIVNYYGK
jgi:hypothetical protein